MKDSTRNYLYKWHTRFEKRNMLNWIPDRIYIKYLFFLRMGKRLSLKDPETYSEKLQWLKLYDRKPSYSEMVDKYDVKEYVKKTIGEEYVVPTYGVWDKFDDINFELLPDQFVLKCTHDSGGLVIVKNKSKFDKNSAREIINTCLKKNYYWHGREWPYKHVKPRIIAEKYLEDENDKELRDYKFFAFDGKVKALFIATDRTDKSTETKFDFFDENFKHLPLTNGHPNADVLPHKPQNFERMKMLAGKLSTGIPQLRVDFYEVNGKVYFGEMTFFHWSGMTPFIPENWDYTFGSWINLEKLK